MHQANNSEAWGRYGGFRCHWAEMAKGKKITLRVRIDVCRCGCGCGCGFWMDGGSAVDPHDFLVSSRAGYTCMYSSLHVACGNAFRAKVQVVYVC